MGSSISTRTIGILSILAALALVVGTLTKLAPGAGAATNTCQAKNLTQSTATVQDLQAAIDAANPGDTIRVKRICVGNFVIKKDLTLVGEPTRAVRKATLDANGSGGVVFMDGSYLGGPSGIEVTLTNLKLTGGNTLGGYGGGIYNDDGDLTLDHSVVRGNRGSGGAGIHITMEATLVMNDSVVKGNRARTGGGGVANHGALTLNGSSSVSGNTAQAGGGILNGGEAALILNDRSTVSGNMARDGGGGILNNGSVTMNGGSSVRGNVADLDADGSGVGGGILSCGSGILVGVIDGGNVDENHLGNGTENNIALCLPRREVFARATSRSSG